MGSLDTIFSIVISRELWFVVKRILVLLLGTLLCTMLIVERCLKGLLIIPYFILIFTIFYEILCIKSLFLALSTYFLLPWLIVSLISSVSLLLKALVARGLWINEMRRGLRFVVILINSGKFHVCISLQILLLVYLLPVLVCHVILIHLRIMDRSV